MSDVLLHPKESELEHMLTQIDLAMKEDGKQREVRQKAFQVYHRQPLGNEEDNRSQYIASEAANVVDSTLPHLVKRFISINHGIGMDGPDSTIAKGLLNLCTERIRSQGGFRFIHDSLKDGLVEDNGTAKTYWKNVFEDPIDVQKDGLLREDYERMKADPEIAKITDVQQGTPRVSETGELDVTTGQPVTNAEPTLLVSMQYRKLKESGPVLDNIPTDEVLFGTDKRRMNDRHPAGHRKRITLGELKKRSEEYGTPDKPYYHNLAAVANTTADDNTEMDDERRTKEGVFVDYTETNNEFTDETNLRSEVEIIEWQDNVYAKGKLIPAILTFANRVLIRAEENLDGFIELSTWSPSINPHRIYGESLASKDRDLDHLTTMLVRSLLDSVAFSIDKPLYVEGNSTDMLGLANRWPGKVTPVQNMADVHEVDIQPINADLFKIIEYLKGDSENRGPVTRYNQGTDAGSLNKTATGISLIQKAAFTRIDMIALTYAENFLSDVYQKLVTLYQRNMIQPEKVMVDGKEITLTRESIQGDYRAYADLGVEVDFNEREFEKASIVLDKAVALSQVYPMFFNLEKIYNVVSKWFSAAGIKEPDKFLSPPHPSMAQWYEGLEQMPELGMPGAEGNQAEGGDNSVPDESLMDSGGGQ